MKTVKLALKNSEEELKRKEKRNKVFKFASKTGLCLAVSALVISIPSIAHADVNELNALFKEQPLIYSKMQYLVDFYKNCCDILGVAESKELFVQIIKEVLNPAELYMLVKSAKGLSLQEIISMIAPLLTLGL